MSSALSDLPAMEVDGHPMAGVQSAGEPGERMAGIESKSGHAEDNAGKDDDNDHNSDSEMEVDGPTAGVRSAGKSGGPMVAVESESDNGENDAESEEEEDSDAVEEDGDEDGDEPTMEPMMAKGSDVMKKPSTDLALADQLASVGLRRSARNKASAQVVSESPQVASPVPLRKIVVKRKSVVQKDSLIDLVSVGNSPTMHTLTTGCSGELGP